MVLTMMGEPQVWDWLMVSAALIATAAAGALEGYQCLHVSGYQEYHAQLVWNCLWYLTNMSIKLSD